MVDSADEAMKKVNVVLLRKIGAEVKRRAMRLCPVDMGQLRASIDYEINVEQSKVTISAIGDGAHAMEYGAPPGELSQSEKDDVTKWAKRHGLKSGKGVIKHIETKGIKAGTPENPYHVTTLRRDSYRPFLRPAVHQAMPTIKKMIKETFV